jgi:hypothetical protein
VNRNFRELRQKIEADPQRAERLAQVIADVTTTYEQGPAEQGSACHCDSSCSCCCICGDD